MLCSVRWAVPPRASAAVLNLMLACRQTPSCVGAHSGEYAWGCVACDGA